MSPITFDEAYAQTNPTLSEDARGESARQIMAGVAANDAYWNSRSDLEALIARSEGHGVVSRGEDQPAEVPTGLGTSTATAPHIDSTAEEVGLGSGTSTEATAGTGTEPAGTASTGGGGSAPPPPDAEVVGESDADKLRAQLRALGATPEV